MKRLQLQRWSSSVLSPRARTVNRLHQHIYGQRCQSTASPIEARDDQTTAIFEEPAALDDQLARIVKHSHTRKLQLKYPSPPVNAARKSAKLAALHARLYLPSRLPIETLARTLVDASADPNSNFNNASLATLGHDLLSYYATEHLICTYPRLPLTVIFAAMYAYVGPKTLAAMAREWGVDLAALPGGEVDPGLLQFQRVDPGAEIPSGPTHPTARPYEAQKNWRKTVTSKIFYDDEFGDPLKGPKPSAAGVTTEQASAEFVRAVMGAIYLHAGRAAAKRFFEQHFLSRHLNISELFNFQAPARDLTRLCARESFERPVAKVISETGRKSRHPVFVVGIFSGQDKLGEGAGASLMEARERAAVAALKGWYLYSPLSVRVPSAMEEPSALPWKPVHVDLGEVIV
ncbi:Double-stranded RNA-binding [Penicillium griseofulvum]|uniref:Large ribosomal subunit protein mL44 n=1 Tax=Penicillium patulum TaxID=5078 RepID=A0A135LJA1_PENPA|nr:Double-stranded RNA-binding [Penicillium griseofulvum]KXG49043.1 Double-stranded RNA-binding [Penicillium griseofulvum]